MPSGTAPAYPQPSYQPPAYPPPGYTGRFTDRAYAWPVRQRETVTADLEKLAIGDADLAIMHRGSGARSGRTDTRNCRHHAVAAARGHRGTGDRGVLLG